ncbi:MAG: hypothetical protein IIA67_03950 [Planctomycetes bacterium]|nr:hypothetical protein [Planctomycetota bacterium]
MDLLLAQRPSFILSHPRETVNNLWQLDKLGYFADFEAFDDRPAHYALSFVAAETRPEPIQLTAWCDRGSLKCGRQRPVDKATRGGRF